LSEMGGLGSMIDGSLNQPMRNRAIAFSQRPFPQADAQSRARDLQRTNGHPKPVSDLLSADSLCHPVFNSRDILGREFCWLSGLVILPNSRTSYRRHN
jgi:hypothetical protein